MENIMNTIDSCADGIKAYRDTIQVLNWLSTIEDLPGTANLTVMRGVWIDLASIDEWKALRRALGRRLFTSYFHTMKRNDRGQIKISYSLSIEPFTHEEVEAATRGTYISEISLEAGHPVPVVHCVVCVNPGPECTKVLKGTETKDVYEWVCEEGAINA